MATLQLTVRRLILAGGFAVALAAAPAIAVFSVPDAASVAQGCAGGEEPDPFIGTCLPHTVPNSGSGFEGIPGNPSLPAIAEPGGGGAIPCTGHDSGQCIGLAEEDAAAGPAAVPKSSESNSPTVTGGE